MIRRMLDIIGISCKAILLTAAILVGAVGPVAAMDTTKMILHFWGGGDDWPEGTVYLTDSDGAYITDSDGAYITF